MKAINLGKLTVDELLALRDRVNAMLAGRVQRERRELERRLKRLQHFGEGEDRPRRGRPPGSKNVKRRGARAGRKVPPKYRNPENRSETWTGRGLQPRWLRAALKAGKKLEDFRIAKKG